MSRVPQHAEDAAQVVQRLVGLGLDDRGALAHLVGGRGRRGTPARRRAWRPGRSGGRARRASPARSGPARRRGPCRPGAPARPRRARPGRGGSRAAHAASRCTCPRPATRLATTVLTVRSARTGPRATIGWVVMKNCAATSPSTPSAHHLPDDPPGGQRDRGQRGRAARDPGEALSTAVSTATWQRPAAAEADQQEARPHRAPGRARTASGGPPTGWADRPPDHERDHPAEQVPPDVRPHGQRAAATRVLGRAARAKARRRGGAGGSDPGAGPPPTLVGEDHPRGRCGAAPRPEGWGP